MTDATHGLFYSWFAQIVEGAGNRLDEAIAHGRDKHATKERRAAGPFPARAAPRQPLFANMPSGCATCSGSTAACPQDIDPLDPAHFDTVADAVAAERHDPEFAARVLAAHHIRAYVTSIENRDQVPLVAARAAQGR